MTPRPAPPRPLTAHVPGSKSITTRALLLAAAANGTSTLWAPLVSHDTLAFGKAVGRLGARVENSPSDQFWAVTGSGRGPTGTAVVWCADAGTAARFLPPFCATGEGVFTFDGSEQLRARPLSPLMTAMTELGAELETPVPGRLPLTVRAAGLEGGELRVDSSMSSQFLSGLLMAAPLMRHPVRADLRASVSRPYLDMTLDLMRRFGADVKEPESGVIEVRPGGYRATALVIEPDASTASYLFAAAAATEQRITVPGLCGRSIQGDLRFVEALSTMGAQVEVGDRAVTVTGTGRLRGGFDLEMGDISDTFMTLAAIAPLADAPLTLGGVRHARFKESDRVAAVTRNLRACGVRVDETEDSVTVHPGTPRPARIACHRDHRIAMAFSVLGLAARVPMVLDDPYCVTKTFPGFHQEMARLFPDYTVPERVPFSEPHDVGGHRDTRKAGER
ncbi:3-phosphoshikimate 1-carboxyvinyltransferase [Streptomyces chumphonensis]|uniref:3-phosphoshikimate 1-carboxyvinyltransferase n=1 Tax=Streptomyces chumphonensis TaxID=1214925 RepID=A0A927F0H9_9ACTN|nr:3-phosphoshikimate 1-carboxyvinyltransferase [Streptomyces chumphonensis]MBD3932121.1 3-phosphoshikimate 1-carboxyvinyltransferase [Streptomyces chumphonensis]